MSGRIISLLFVISSIISTLTAQQLPSISITEHQSSYIVGNEVKFTSTASDDGVLVSLDWNYSDSFEVISINDDELCGKFTSIGTFVISYTAEDNDGQVTTESCEIPVSGYGWRGVSLSIDASDITISMNSPKSYEWLDSDGNSLYKETSITAPDGCFDGIGHFDLFVSTSISCSVTDYYDFYVTSDCSVVVYDHLDESLEVVYIAPGESIQSAIDNIETDSNYDVAVIEVSGVNGEVTEYNEYLVFGKKPIYLRNDSNHYPVTIQGTGNGSVINYTNNYSSCIIEGVTISGGGYEYDDGLDIHLPFDGSNNDNDSVYLGSPNVSQTYVKSKYGEAVELNGIDEYVEYALYFGITGANSRTISAWVKTTDTMGIIVSWGQPADGQYNALCILNGFPAFSAWGGETIGRMSIADGSWHYVAAVLDNTVTSDSTTMGDVVLFVDGIKQQTDCNTPEREINTASGYNMQIGRIYEASGNTYADYYLNGAVDEVRVFDRALSKVELSNLYTDSSGAIQASGSSVLLSNCIIAGNQASGYVDSLAAYWSFDEGNSSVIEDNIESYDGVLKNGPVLACGAIGGAIELDGVNDYIEIESYDGIEGTGARTISAWVKTTDTTGVIVSWGEPGADGQFSAMYIENGCLGFSAWGGQAIGQTNIADGGWHHVMAMMDASSSINDVDLYVDGIIESVNIDQDIDINTATVYHVQIGRIYEPAGSTLYQAYYYNGLIDEVRIYQRALAMDELQDIYYQRESGVINDLNGQIINCTITDNGDSDDSAEILSNCTGSILNTIIKGNNSDDYMNCNSTIQYSCISNLPEAPSTNLEASWSMEGDNFANENDTVNGAELTSGRIGHAYLFNGVSDYISIGSYHGVSGTTERTVSAWIKTGASGNYQGIISWGTPNTDGKYWGLFVNSDGRLGCSAWGSDIYSSGTVNDNQWHHVAVSWPGGTGVTMDAVSIFIDGIPVNFSLTQPDPATIDTDADQDVHIGGFPEIDETWYFSGLIDEVSIYSKALSPSEIKTLYGIGNINIDLGFKDFVSGDYHLDSYSDLINSGDPISDGDGIVDIDGDVRENVGRVDIGADEAVLLEGYGTEESPYLIQSLEDFDIFASHPDFWAAGIYTKLVCDLDLSGREYNHAVIAPSLGDVSSADENGIIFFVGDQYEGVFDGSNYIIHNLNIIHPTHNAEYIHYMGLFGKIGENGCVKNVIVSDFEFLFGLNGFKNNGAVCGHNNGKIENCYSNGSISQQYTEGPGIYTQIYNTGGLCGLNTNMILNSSSFCEIYGYRANSLGGLCGANQSGVIDNCHALAKIHGGISSVNIGGLCGINGSSNAIPSGVDSIITNSSSTFDIIGAANIGGFVGWGQSVGGYIDNCVANGEIISYGSFVGGFCGFNLYSDISNSYSNVNINLNRYCDYIGGFAGRAYFCYIENCHSECNINGAHDCDFIGGFCGDIANGGKIISQSYPDNSTDPTHKRLKISRCFSTGKIDVTTGAYIEDNASACWCIGGFIGGCSNKNEQMAHGALSFLISDCYSQVDIEFDQNKSIQGYPEVQDNYIGGFIGDIGYAGSPSNLVRYYYTDYLIKNCYTVNDCGEHTGGRGFYCYSVDCLDPYINPDEVGLLKCFWNSEIHLALKGYEYKLVDVSEIIDSTKKEMQTLSTYTEVGWDFSFDDGDPPVWYLPPNDYPKLIGQVWYVDQSDSIPEEDRDGKSWDTAFEFIQEGVDAAQDGDIVAVAPGTYSGKTDINEEYINQNNVVEINGKSIYLVGYDYQGTGGGIIIDANGTEANPRRGIKISCIIEDEIIENVSPEINGFVINGGYGPSEQWGVGIPSTGGGIFIEGISECNLSPVIKNCEITGNESGYWGGGIYAKYANPVLYNCNIHDNISGDVGGGVYMYECANPGIIRSCKINRNSTVSGGGLWLHSCNSLLLEDCEISNNIVYRNGGGLFVFRGNVTLNKCNIFENLAKGASDSEDGGGGIRVSASGKLTVVNSVLFGNTTVDEYDGVGGGIDINNSSKLYIYNSTFAYNNITRIDGTPVYDSSRGNCINAQNNSEVSLYNTVLWDGHAGDSCELVLLSGSSVKNLTDYTVINWIDKDPVFISNPNDGNDGWCDYREAPIPYYEENPIVEVIPDFDETANNFYGNLRLLGVCSPCVDAGYLTIEADTIDSDVYLIDNPFTFDYDGYERICYNGSFFVFSVAFNPIDFGAYEYNEQFYGNLPPHSNDDEFSFEGPGPYELDVLINDCDPESSAIFLNSYPETVDGFLITKSEDSEKLVLAGAAYGTQTIEFEYDVSDQIAPDSISNKAKVIVVITNDSEPVVLDAGIDKEIELPDNTVDLSDAVFEGGDSSKTKTQLWTVTQATPGLTVDFDASTPNVEEVSTALNPEIALIVDPAIISANDSLSAVLTLTLTGYEDNVEVGSDSLFVTLLPGNIVFNAGRDRDFTWPDDKENDLDYIEFYLGESILTGSYTATYKWELVSNSFGYSIAFDDDTKLNPTVTLEISDTSIFHYYSELPIILSLTAATEFQVLKDTVVLTVKSNLNNAPIVDAGIYGDINLDDTLLNYSLALAPIIFDDGRPLGGLLNVVWEVVGAYTGETGSAEWIKPEYSFVDGVKNAANAMINFFKEATYILEVTVSDGEFSSSARTEVNVTGDGNQPPVVDIENDMYTHIIHLYDSISILNGISASITDDHDNSDKLQYSWKITGVSGGCEYDNNIIDIEGSESTVTLDVEFFKPGQYILELTASDGYYEVTDEAVIIVSDEAYEFEISAPVSVILPESAILEGRFYVESIPYDVVRDDVTVQWHQVFDDNNGIKISTEKVEFLYNSDTLIDAEVVFQSPGIYKFNAVCNYMANEKNDECYIKVLPGIKIYGSVWNSMVVDDSKNRYVWTVGDQSLLQAGSEQSVFDKLVFARIKNGNSYLGNIVIGDVSHLHSLAVEEGDSANRKMWAWGANDGRLGIVDYSNQDNLYGPICVNAGEQKTDNTELLDNIIEVSASDYNGHTLAIDNTGSVYAWGNNAMGQLGIGSSGGCISTPVVVKKDSGSALTNIKSISAGTYHSIALEEYEPESDNILGRVYAFGNPNNGALGVGVPDQTVDYGYPHFVKSGAQGGSNYLEKIVAVSAGYEYTLALENREVSNNVFARRVYSWGNNTSMGGGRRLGNDTGENIIYEPILVKVDEENILENIISISAGQYHGMALDDNGNVWTWGNDNYGQLGNGTGVSTTYAVKVKAPDRDYDGESDDLVDSEGNDIDDYLGKDIPIIAIEAGSLHCLALDEMGNIYTWGFNACGQLGFGDTVNRQIPTQLPPLGGNVNNLRTSEWFTTIQEAIDASSTGDTLVVYPGKYQEQIIIDKDIILKSIAPEDRKIVEKTIIRWQTTYSSNSVISIDDGDNNVIISPTITGFTIKSFGTCFGISCLDESPKISNNIITDNYTGVECGSKAPEITSNIISNNISYINAISSSIGINCYVSSSKILNNIVVGNRIGINSVNNPNAESLLIRNNTIVDNVEDGVYSYRKLTLKNNIIINNGTDISGTSFNVQHCALEYVYVDNDSAEDYNNFIVTNDIFADGTFYELAYEYEGNLNLCIDGGNKTDIPDDEKDINGNIRVLRKSVDIGACEYKPYLVDAGEDKVVIVNDALVFDDATVIHNLPIKLIGDVTVEWSVVDGPVDDGLADTYEFAGNGCTDLCAQVCFNTCGVYTLRLNVFEDDPDDGLDVKYPVGWDTVQIIVRHDLVIDSDKASLSFPDEIATLTVMVDDSVADTSDASTYELKWACLSGGKVIFSDETSDQTDITFTKTGLYNAAVYLTDKASGIEFGQADIWIPVNPQNVSMAINVDRTSLTYPDNYFELYVSISGASSKDVKEIVWEVAKDDNGNDIAYFDHTDNMTLVNRITFNEPVANWPVTVTAKDEWGYMVASDVIYLTVGLTQGDVIVDAGEDISIGWSTSIANRAILSAVVKGPYFRTEWTETPGITFSNPESLMTTVTVSDEGSYEIGLEVYGGENGDDLIGYDSMWIHAQPDYAEVDAGDDQYSVLEDAGVEFNLSGKVIEGEPASIQWGLPEGYETLILNYSELDLSSYDISPIFNGEAGDYTFVFKAYNSIGSLIASDDVTVTIDSQYVQVNAGADKFIIDSDDKLFLRGTFNPENIEVTPHWECTNDINPEDYSIDTSDALGTWVSFNKPGIYQFELQAIDDYGVVLGHDDVIVTVIPFEWDIEFELNVEYEQVQDSGYISIANIQTVIDGDYDEFSWIYHNVNTIPSEQVTLFEVENDDTLSPTIKFLETGTNDITMKLRKGDYLASKTITFDVTSDSVDEYISSLAEGLIQEASDLDIDMIVEGGLSKIMLGDGSDVRLKASISGYGYDYVEFYDETGSVHYNNISYNETDNTYSCIPQFDTYGIYTLKALLRSGGEYGDIVASDSLIFNVNRPQIKTKAWVGENSGEESSKEFYSLFTGDTTLYLTADIIGGTLTDFSYVWSVIDATSDDIAINDYSNLDASVVISNVGIYTVQLDVFVENEVIDNDQVVISLLGDKPQILLKDITLSPDSGTKDLSDDEVKIFSINGISSYVWSSDIIESGINEEFPRIKNIVVEGIYTLELTVTDMNGYSVTESMNVLVESPAVSVDIGQNISWYTNVPLVMDDVQVTGADTYSWQVTDMYGTELNASKYWISSRIEKNPEIIFYDQGNYKLILGVPFDEDTITDEVSIQIVAVDDSSPSISNFGIVNANGDCGINEIIFDVTDDNISDVELRIINNSSGESVPIPVYSMVTNTANVAEPEMSYTYTYHFDPHTLAVDEYTLSASVYDENNNNDQYDYNGLNISLDITEFVLSTNVINATDDVLVVSADINNGAQWSMYVIDVNDEVVEPLTLTSHTGNVSESISYNELSEGMYKLEIVTDNDIACASFVVNKKSSIVKAYISDSLKADIGENGIPFSKMPTISEGIFKLYGVAYHPVFPEKVKYKITLADRNSNICNVTPGIRDKNGYASGYVGSYTQSGEEFNFSNGEFDSIDLTNIADGVYTLTVTASCLGRFDSDSTTVNISNNLKIGNVKFTQEDMAIPVGGVPIRVVRTYDSLNKDIDGEFGYGWSYSFADLDIEMNENRTPFRAKDDTSRVGGFYDRDVTLTLPDDGRRVTFSCVYEKNFSSMSEWPKWKVRYEAPAGVNAQLRLEQNETLRYQDPTFGFGSVSNKYAGYFWDNEVTPGDFSQNDISKRDFKGYVLTLEDGTVYHINRKKYPERDVNDYLDNYAYSYTSYGKPYVDYIKFPDGDEIKFDVDTTQGENPTVKGIKYYNENSNDLLKSIKLEYNDYNRIERVYPPSELDEDGEPAENAIPYLVYNYDSYGNLATVEKLVEKGASQEDSIYESTTYVYTDYRHQPGVHYVTSIKDSRGIAPIQYIYDEDGRLTGTIDARGRKIKINHNITGRQEVVTDRSNNVTIYEYNERGNVTHSINSNGYTTIYKYLDGDYPDGASEVWVPIAANADPDNSSDYSITITDFDSNGRPIEIIDPAGNIAANQYDSKGNLILSTVTEKVGNSWAEITHRNFYDQKNRLVVSGTTTGDINNLTWHTININLYENNLILHTVQIDTSILTDYTKYDYLAESLNSYLNSGSYSDYVLAIDEFTTIGCVSGHGEAAVVTTYDYNYGASGSKDQPYRVSRPYYAGQSASYIGSNCNHYDTNGNLDYSYTLWHDPAGLQSEPLYIINYNELDAQGKAKATWQIVDTDSIPFNEEENEIRIVTSQTFYDSIGKVESTYDQYGAKIQYYYDELGNTTLVENYAPDGALLTKTFTYYDESGRAIISVGPIDIADYDENDSSTWLPAAETVYDDLGRVIVTRHWEHVNITLVEILDAQSNIVGYSAVSWVHVAAEPLSYTRTIYDAAGRVAHSVSLSVDADGNAHEQSTSYIYDIAGRQTAVIPPETHNTSSFVYLPSTDRIKADVQMIDFDSFDNDTWVSGSYAATHYSGSRRDHVIDAKGNETHYKYDALGRVVRTQFPAYDANGDGIISPVDEGVTYTHIGYDGLGRKLWESEQVTQADAANVDINDCKYYSYDLSGRLVQMTLPQVDGNGDGSLDDVVYTYIYDDYGNQVGILDPLGRLTAFKYDHFGNQIEKYPPFVLSYIPETPEGDIDLNALNAAYVYNQLSQASGIQLALSSIYYADPDITNSFGKLQYTIDAKGQQIEYIYDTFGRLEYKCYYETDALYASEAYHYYYDNLGRNYQVDFIDYINSANNYSEITDFDREGRVISETTPQGVVNYQYNTVTGNKDRTWTDMTETQFSYDESGRLKETILTKSNGVVLDGVDGRPEPQITQYGYDANGNREYMTLPTGAVTQYEYDSLNRLDKLINDAYSTFDYTVGANGMRTGVVETVAQTGGGSKLNNKIYDYDNLNRVIEEKQLDDNNDGFRVVYEYDLAGNRHSRTVHTVSNGGDVLPKHETIYEYDVNNDRLETETSILTQPSAAAGSPDSPIYAYVNQNGGDVSWHTSDGEKLSGLRAYFAGLPTRANWVSYLCAILAIPGLFASSLLLRRRNMSRFNRGIAIVLIWLFILGPGTLSLLANDASYYLDMVNRSGYNNTIVKYDYDENGSLISKITAPISDQDNPTESVSYTYNLQGRLESVTTVDAGGASTVEYKYNSSGLRIAKIVDGIETIYLIDSSNHTGYAQVLEEWSGGSTPDITYTIGDDVIAQTDSSNNTDYLLYDGHGSTRQLLNSSGVAAVYDYDAYGIDTQSSGSASTSLQYTGEMKDAETDDYYLRARYYSPSNGRFNRVDPYSGNMQDPQSLHKYLYCHANPVNGWDPSGMEWENAWIGSEIHKEIANMYMLEHSSNTVLSNNYSIPGINEILKPDIMDFTKKTIIEIKPLEAKQMAEGVTKLIGYLVACNENNVPGAYNSSIKEWTPGTWGPSLRIVPIPKYPNYCAVILGNANGLLVYKRFKCSPDEMKLLLTVELAREIINEFDKLTANMGEYGKTAAPVGVLAYMSRQLASLRLAQSRNMARNVSSIVGASMVGYLGARIVISGLSRGLI